MENALFEFMFSTGCRIGEIVSLEKNCIIGLIILPSLEERGTKKERFILILAVIYG
jgi:site-specific recombinase XerD